MIRPLEYCVNTQHINASIDTIDNRIVELLALRKTYLNKAKVLQDDTDNEQNRIKNISSNQITLAKRFDLPVEFVRAIFQEIDNYFNQDYTTRGYEQQ
ncbi:hypothetical protein BWD42_20115 [Sphingobacterium sp. CZ-UAM]|uniref:chorismate mutase n=1 Tax=Sphingobacterium sp. CZ-UAM TaxID=1933868 RepID=UPI000985B714|nr:chorismate mutase [Sphingobacterium sp. CZ-UAM]OOG16541.1 hypothetical protein BWD42_20115 [Sphingobacterium sp. CZ-UAM]